MIQSGQLDGATNLMTMSELDILKRILAYVVENRLKVALEAEIQHMVGKANEL